MLYDALLVIALMMIITAMFLPFTHGEAITYERVGALEYLYRGVLLAVIFVFFGWSWTRSGQTVGMTAWRLRIERPDGTLLTWREAMLRIAGAFVSLAALGLGYFWIWIDRDRLAWHDRWTQTRVAVLPKRRK
jgi:uncharacterized RDD family membrane protein YckC